MDDLLGEFLTEASESLERLDAEIVRLERNPSDPELLGGVFRLMHTIKGTCGFLGLHRLEALAHAGENVLGNFRDGVQPVSHEAVSLIFRVLDRIRSLIAILEQTKAEPAGDDSDLLACLAGLSREAGGGQTEERPAATIPAADGGIAPVAHGIAAAPGPRLARDAAASLHGRLGLATIDAAVEICLGKLRGDTEVAPFLDLVGPGVLQGRLVELLTGLLGGPTYRGPDLARVVEDLAGRGLSAAHVDRGLTRLREAFACLDVAAPDLDRAMSRLGAARRDLFAAPAAARPAPARSHEVMTSPAAIMRPSIRVAVDAMENLMTSVSDLVLARNRLLQVARRCDDAELGAPLERLSHVTSELRRQVMKARLQPVANAWGKLPRLVRDLAAELGKRIELDLRGGETELDRQVLDMIKDPLTHMVRNCADHGIETPDERRQAGKDPTGRIVLNARHEAGRVVIEVQDDGRGIDLAKVRRRAASAGIATAAELAAMPEHRLQQLIFRPGFSTADRVTAVSGRGVGMDVVRANVQKIGGEIEIASVAGRGATFAITIPLTLAIVPALVVQCAGDRLAIPQPAIVEIVRVSMASGHRVETIGRAQVLRLRDRLLPLVSLAALLRLDPGAGGDGAVSTAEREPFVVVVQAGPARFGLAVDRVLDTEEIVIKPIVQLLRHIGLYSGAAVLGDGSVIMVLDPGGIADAAGEIAVADPAHSAGVAEATSAERRPLLLFRAGSREPKAVPLDLVARLETFEPSAVETTGGLPVVQYRGRLLPLASIDATPAARLEKRQSVIVLGDDEASVGLVADEIVDIVEDRLDLLPGAPRAGVLGSAIVAGRATEIIDVAAYLARVHREGSSCERHPDTRAGGRKRLLLVDDSPFFVSLLVPILASAGYAVTGVGAPGEALELRDRGEDFDVIVSDIDMPGMDGFEFARAVRAGGPWKDVPLIALASRATPADFAKGREAGFIDFVAKVDRAALLETLSQSGAPWRGAA